MFNKMIKIFNGYLFNINFINFSAHSYIEYTHIHNEYTLRLTFYFIIY